MYRRNSVASKLEYFQTKHPLEKYLRSLFFSAHLSLCYLLLNKSWTSAWPISILFQFLFKKKKKGNFETVFLSEFAEKSSVFVTDNFLTDISRDLTVPFPSLCHHKTRTWPFRREAWSELSSQKSETVVECEWYFYKQLSFSFLCVVVIESKDGSRSYRDPSPGQLTHLCGRVRGPRPNIKSGK